MTHYNCHNPKHKGGTCCDCYPKINCSWEHSEDKTKPTPDRIDEILDQFDPFNISHHDFLMLKPEAKAQLQAHIDKVVEEAVVEYRNKITTQDRPLDAEPLIKEMGACNDCGSTNWADWTIMPHQIFNASKISNKGSYLCLPCFCKRVLEQRQRYKDMK